MILVNKLSGVSGGWVAAVLLVVAESIGVCAGYNVNVGDILIANYNGGSVVKIDPVTGAQQQLGGAGDFSVPTDLVLDPNGNLFVCEWGGAIKRLDLANGSVTTVLNSGSGPSQVWGITRSPSGDLFVTSRGNNTIYQVNVAAKSATPLTQDNLLSTLVGIDMLDANHLVVACLLANRLVSISLADNSQSAVQQGGGLDQPWGVAVSGTDIYLAGYDAKHIQRLSAGIITNIATVADTPYGLALDPSGDIVVGLQGLASSVVRISPAGVVLRTYTGSLIHQATGVEISAIQVSANTPPVPTNPGLAAVRNQPVSFSAAKLATDPDGDPLTFEVSPTSASGGTVSLLAGVGTYTPATDFTGSDSFTYTVNDGRGGAANGTVTVTVSSGLAVSLNVVYGPLISGELFVVRFAGVPGCTYTLESSTDLASWAKVANVVAPTIDEGWGVGVGQFSEPTSGDTQRYYRTVDPAY